MDNENEMVDETPPSQARLVLSYLMLIAIAAFVIYLIAPSFAA